MTNDLIRNGYTFDDQNTYITNQFVNNPSSLDEITAPDFSPAYWWGWVSWDDLPTSAHLSRHSIDDDGNVVFTDITRRENIDLTYTLFYNTTLPSDYYKYNYYYRYDADLGRWRAWRANTAMIPNVGAYSRLYNRSDVNIYAFYQARLQFSASVDGTTRVLINAFCPIPDLYNDNFSISGSFSSGGYSAITITAADMIGDVVTRSHDGHTIKMCLQSIGVDLYARPITTAGALSRYIIPHPAYHIHDEEDNAYLIAMTYDGTGQPEYGTAWQGGGIRLASSGAINSAPQDLDTGVIAGGFAGTITPNMIAAIGSGQDLIPVPDANFALAGIGRSDLLRVVRMYDLAEARRIFGYQMRMASAEAQNKYENTDDQYYPLVTGSQFMGTLIKGVRDRDRLQPWQLVGAAVDPETNDYKPSDKPVYIPPDPEEGDKIGDSIGFNRTFPSGSATGLFTLYALRQAHVSQLGAKLWATLNDPDENFWQNLQFAIGAFAETGSADISSVLEYVTSFRIYPFALINLPGYANAGTGAIRLGTGKIALDLGSGGIGNVGIMGQYTGLIDAGSVYIPAHFEDFRDLEDVTISAYLPYIGNIPLNPAEVTGCTISAQYAVDLTSGSCVAYLLLSGKWGYYPIGVYSGTIGADIPLTASQGNRLFLRNLSQMIGLSSVFGSGVMGSAQNAEDDSQFLRGIGSSATAAAAYGASTTLTRAAGASLTPPTLGSSANFAGFGAPQTAYIQIRRAQYAYTGRSFPAATYGHRTAQRATIGALSGFTKCINPDVSKIPAPAAIQRSIKAKLEAGVYI